MIDYKIVDDRILFSFVDRTDDGCFIDSNNSGLIELSTVDIDNQALKCRWGKVVTIGEDCKQVKVGDYILVEALCWTRKFHINGETLNGTNESKVICIGDERVSASSF